MLDDCWASERLIDVCSHIFTVRSKEEEAMIEPNSGCAQLIFETGASWAWHEKWSE